jgi:glutamyl-tRNA reductase
MSSKKLSIIGSGNVANYFASTFYDNGINVNQITSKNIEHAQLLANKVNSNAIAKISDLDLKYGKRKVISDDK